MSLCKNCNNERFIFHTCCSGFQCGCMGVPVAVSPCVICNYDGNIKPNNDLWQKMKHMEYIENNEKVIK